MPKAAATIVLVHGAWTDASSWNKVIPILQTEGLSVIAAQLALTSIEEDVAATTCAMADVEGPIVLVGHGWGGMAVTEAGESQKVSALVYVAAFVPDVGESGSGLIGAHPAPPALSTVVTNSAGYVYQTVDGFVNNVAPDLPARDAKVMTVTQGPLAAKAFEQTVKVAAWEKQTLLVYSIGERSRGQPFVAVGRCQADGCEGDDSSIRTHVAAIPSNAVSKIILEAAAHASGKTAN